MSRQENTSRASYGTSSTFSESFYPTREQFACVRCKNKKFTSWNDFENHHAKHAVDFTFSQLPFVKLQRIKIPSFNSEGLKAKHQDSETQSSISIIDSIETATSTSDVVPEASNKIPAPCENKEPPESKIAEEEEMLTWPGSCESHSPLNSPINIPVSSPSEITSINTATGESQMDSNILDPAFIEKLGEEINFLNQTSVESVTETITNGPKESSSDVHGKSLDVNISGSSSSSISTSDFPVPSIDGSSFAEPITPETPPAENVITSVESDKPEDQLEKVLGEKDVSDIEKNVPISSPKEAELPKSKGQLRLVPYESLLSPSFLHANPVDDDESPAIQSPISPSKTSNKPQPMVAIPEQNLEDLNILAHKSTANSVLVKALTEAVSTPQQVLQKSRPTPPPEITVPTTQTASVTTQQQRMTQIYQFHGQDSRNIGNRQLQVTYQQQPAQQQPQQSQQHQQTHPQLQSQLQQHLQQQPQLQQHLQQQPQIQQQQQQLQQQQQQQVHFQQQQYLQQQHQNLTSLQYQQQQQAYQQIGTGQQQNVYAQASHYIQRFPNPPLIQYPVQTYSASCRAPQPSQPTRAAMNSAMTLSNSNGTTHVPSVSTYFQQTANNSLPSMSASNHIQHQLAGHSIYNHAVVHTNNSFPHYSTRPQTSTIQHVQLQVQTTRPPVSTTQIRSQATTLPSQGIRVASSSAVANSVRLPPPSQQGQAFVAIRPHPQPPISVCPPRGSLTTPSQVTPNSQLVNVILPTTSTTLTTTSSTIRLPAPSHQGQTAPNALNRPVGQKRPLVVEGGISSAGQSAHKISRSEEVTAVSMNVSTVVSTAQQSGDCEVLIVQKKQTGLPVIQSVEGGGSSSTKSSVQVLQTPSVASLLSNPNITITPAKNKENQTGSDSVASKSVNASTSSVVNATRTSRPITIDLTSAKTSLPQQRNPLQCQVCNETFNSQSLLKNHLVLHLRKVHPTTARSASSSSIARNHGSKQAAVNPSISRASNVSGQTTGVTTPSTSGYVTTQSSTTPKNLTPAGIRPIDTDTGIMNANQQTKNGATSGQNRPTNEIYTPPTTSPTQSSCNKEPTAISTDKATSDSNEFYIPVVDLKRLDVITQLESMGINQFIPASNLTSCTGHSNFAIPIMSASALRRTGTTGFPNLCGVVNLGSPKPFSSTPPK